MQHWSLLEQVFTVETIMTPRAEFLLWSGTEPIDQLWQRANDNKIDVIPVLSNDNIISVLYQGGCDPIQLKEDQFIAYNVSIPKALKLLNRKECLPFLLVTYQNMVVGLVTKSDFNKLPTRTYFYNLLANLEMELAERIRKHFHSSHEKILELLKKDKSEEGKQHYDKLCLQVEQMKQTNTEIDVVHFLNLSQLIKVVRETDELRTALGFTSRSQVDKQINGLVHFRNDVMHSVKLILNENRSFEKLCEQVDKTLDILERWRNDKQFEQTLAKVPDVELDKLDRL